MAKTLTENLVTVIIPVYNREDLIAESLDSVLQQSHPDVEVIVIDDGSTDRTIERIKPYLETDPRVRLIQQNNAGPGVARQAGLDIATGEYIQFLDSDDLLLPQKLALQVSALCKEPTAVAAYGKTELIDLGAARNYIAWKRTGVVSKSMFPEFLLSRWWGTSTPLYRHSTLRLIGPWLPLINNEDWEYDCRLAALGKPLVFIDEFVSVQRRHFDHLSAEGGSDLRKLNDRATAQFAIYDSALKSKTLIPQSYFDQFSKSVFHLARQCAAKNLAEPAAQLIELSKRSGNYFPYKQWVFRLLARLFGWPFAARFASKFESKGAQS